MSTHQVQENITLSSIHLLNLVYEVLSRKQSDRSVSVHFLSLQKTTFPYSWRAMTCIGFLRFGHLDRDRTSLGREIQQDIRGIESSPSSAL